MKYFTIFLLVILMSACGETTYTQEELNNYKKTVNCTGYPELVTFEDVSNQQLKKASIEQCEHKAFVSQNKIKPSPKKEW
jgi:entry exclusion lipoprotein TrbK